MYKKIKNDKKTATPKAIFENKMVLKTETYPNESNHSQSAYNPESVNKATIINIKNPNILFLIMFPFIFER